MSEDESSSASTATELPIVELGTQINEPLPIPKVTSDERPPVAPVLDTLKEELRETQGYSSDQLTYITDHYGLTAEPGTVLVTRSQVDRLLPTANQSCCLIVPEQNSFYSDTGLIYQVPIGLIPWVVDGDAGTEMTTNEIQVPENALSVGEYLGQEKHMCRYARITRDIQL